MDEIGVFHPYTLSMPVLIAAENKKAERAGFDFPTFCKLIKNLYLQLNVNSDKDLGSLVSLLLKHDFILF
jgi:hypothetical protein